MDSYDNTADKTMEEILASIKDILEEDSNDNSLPVEDTLSPAIRIDLSDVKEEIPVYYPGKGKVFIKDSKEYIAVVLKDGEKIEDYTDRDLRKVQDWLNNYPRGIFNYESANDRFQRELQKLGIQEDLHL